MLKSKPQTYSLADHDSVLNHGDTYVLRFRDMPDDDKPRERLLRLGPGELTVSELLAVIWGVGTAKEDVLTMAKRTFKEYGDRAIGNETNPVRLSEATGIPFNKACQAIASFELGRRFHSQRAGRPMQVRNARQAHQYMRDIGDGQKEQLRGLYLNSRYQVIHDEVLSVGSLTANIVHPREVFQPAIERGAVAVILAHNHPSGRLEPSIHDIEITKQLIEAGNILGIDLLDHLVIAKGRYASIMECIR